MGQNCFPEYVNPTLLFPPSLHDWLPEGHLARFLVDVVSALDLDAIYASYREKDGRGQAAYAPEMMVRLLLYGYASGVYSSRKIQMRTYEDVAFRFLSGDQHPDHATIAEFRKRHLNALSGLFTQALLLCSEAGLVKLGTVALEEVNLGPGGVIGWAREVALVARGYGSLPPALRRRTTVLAGNYGEAGAPHRGRAGGGAPPGGQRAELPLARGAPPPREHPPPPAATSLEAETGARADTTPPPPPPPP